MSASPKVILCDVDGVVADLHTAWLSAYNRDYQDTLTYEQITAWSMDQFVKPECGEQIYKYIREPYLYDWDAVRPIKGAFEGIQALRRAGFRVVFLSSCVPGSTDAKVRWLIRHGFLSDLERTPSDFIAAHSKGLVRGDLLIDDAVHNVVSFGGPAILMDAPYNQELQVSQHYHCRAFSWDDVLIQVGQILGPTDRAAPVPSCWN